VAGGGSATLRQPLAAVDRSAPVATANAAEAESEPRFAWRAPASEAWAGVQAGAAEPQPVVRGHLPRSPRATARQQVPPTRIVTASTSAASGMRTCARATEDELERREPCATCGWAPTSRPSWPPARHA